MKRLIFTLLHSEGKFMLSRNFRLQHVGGEDWLLRHYNLPMVSRGLDELMILDVTAPGRRDRQAFCSTVERVRKNCFIPLTLGGGIESVETGREYIRAGADKLLLNTAFISNPNLAARLTKIYGQQCIVAGVDYVGDECETRAIHCRAAAQVKDLRLEDHVRQVLSVGAGELLLQSVDRDGTGMGVDLDVVSRLGSLVDVPCILMGGVGRAEHIIDAMTRDEIDAVATANLFNFIGATFLDVRGALNAAGVELAMWNSAEFDGLRGRHSEALGA